MPTKQEILDGLRTIANRNRLWAMLLHTLVYVLIMALVIKWVPTERFMSLIISLPLATVAIFALLGGNPFNGLLFTLLTMVVLFTGFSIPDQPVTYANPFYMAIGMYMVLFGLVYPHFVKVRSLARYLLVAPFGLIPCPTLSTVIGFLLIFNGLNSPAISIALAAFGLFYGLFGVLKLRVYLDLFLLFGAFTLLAQLILQHL